MSSGPAATVALHAGERKSKGKDRRGPSPEEADATDAVSPALRLSILLVDDDADTRDLYQRFFHWLGHRVVVAEDGVAALQAVLYERHPFDIIVLDLAMPRITGWEVLQTLRREPKTRHVPVLVLSGQHERDSALQAGADAYCDKPCLPAILLLEVQRTIAASIRKRK